ncbi:hypothetical protein ACLK1S_14605 [Escherichia coli]
MQTSQKADGGNYAEQDAVGQIPLRIANSHHEKTGAACWSHVNKARTMSQRLKLFSRLRLRDLMPVPPAVAEYSTGLRMGNAAEQMAKTYGIAREQQDALAPFASACRSAWSDGKLKEEVMTAFIPPYKQPLSKQQLSR